MPTWGLTSPDMTRSGSTPAQAVPRPAPRPAVIPSGIAARPQTFPQQSMPRPMAPPAPDNFGRPLVRPSPMGGVSGGAPLQMGAPRAVPYGPPALGSPGLPMPGQQQMPAAPPPPPRGPVTNNKWRMQQQIGGVTPDARKYAPPAANGLPDQAQRAAGSKQGPQMQTVGGYNFIR